MISIVKRQYYPMVAILYVIQNMIIMHFIIMSSVTLQTPEAMLLVKSVSD